jgi:hypothetical protein
MVINAVTFITKSHVESLENYRQETAKSLDKLRENCSSVYKLVLEGPGALHKKPNPLIF